MSVVDQSAVTQVAERIAREVMGEKLGLEAAEVSANSFGAVLIREGIERYAASMPATQTDQDKLISDLVTCLRDGLKELGVSSRPSWKWQDRARTLISSVEIGGAS